MTDLIKLMRKEMLYHLNMAEKLQYAIALLDGTIEQQEKDSVWKWGRAKI